MSKNNSKASQSDISTSEQSYSSENIKQEISYEMRALSKYYEDYEKAIADAIKKAEAEAKYYELNPGKGLALLEAKNNRFKNELTETFFNKGFTQEQLDFVQYCVEHQIDVIVEGNYDKEDLMKALTKAEIIGQVAEELNKEFYEKYKDSAVYGDFGKDASGIDKNEKNKDKGTREKASEQKETVKHTKSRTGYHIDEEHDERVR